MAEKTESAFSIDESICIMGKISNNLEKHGDEDVTEFNVPIRGLMVPAALVNSLWGDPHFDRAMFNHKRDLIEPMPWTSKSTIKLEEIFDAPTASIKFKNDEVHEFKNCRAKGFVAIPQVGGLTQLDFTLQLCPGLDRANLLLQEYQNEEIKISIASANVAKKKNPKQKEMQLPPKDEQQKAA